VKIRRRAFFSSACWSGNRSVLQFAVCDLFPPCKIVPSRLCVVEKGVRCSQYKFNKKKTHPQQGSALAFNDFLNKAFPNYGPEDFWKGFGVKLFSGGLAGAVANTICYPFDFARTRLASDIGKGKAQFSGIADCIATTVRSQGLTGLYTGWSVTVAGAFVYRAGQLGCFKQIQDMNPYAKDKGALGAASSFVAVTAARTVVMPFNYPFDTVRRRMMLQSEKPVEQRSYKGSFDCFNKVLANEGLAGMYKGMIPELFRGVGGSLVIVAYDRIKVIFGI